MDVDEIDIKDDLLSAKTRPNVVPKKVFRSKVSKKIVIEPNEKLKSYLQTYCDITGLEASAVVKTAIFEYCSQLTGKIE